MQLSHAVLRIALGQAVMWGLVPRNVAQLVRGRHPPVGGARSTLDRRRPRRRAAVLAPPTRPLSPVLKDVKTASGRRWLPTATRQLLGHADSRTTREIYTHVSERMMNQAVQAISDAVGSRRR